MALHKVKDHEGLLKDTRTGAILLADHVKANEYTMKRKSLEDTKRMANEINTIKEKLGEIDEVKSDLSEIKSLLLQIAGNGKQ